MLERIAHAKVNLALHVTGQTDNGYHLLDSLVVFAKFGDLISIKPATNATSLVKLNIDGPFSKGLEVGANNLINRAALALGYELSKENKNLTPVEIKLTKNLPIASGIGGGSADAAATLNGLRDFWNSKIDLKNIALQLGADVPMCLSSKPLRAQGVGEEIALLKCKSPWYLVLVNSGVEVSTPEIFNHLKTKKNNAITPKNMTHMASLDELKTMRNDLQFPAIALEPEIEKTLLAIKSAKPRLFRMSGSGATCFGIYDSEKEANQARDAIQKDHPNWWCIATSTTVS